MEEKRRREKLDYELAINYDNLLVKKDHLRVEEDALKKASHRRVKVGVTKDNDKLQAELEERMI